MKKQLNDIIHVMGRVHGLNILQYDESFLSKSLERRLAATGIRTLPAYSEFLSENRTEAEAFYNSLNIAYSEFFRNPLAFSFLEQVILPRIMANKEKSGRAEIRIWSAGCAAGQEAYSIAMLLDEMSTERKNSATFRIFATDCCETELATARKGVYDISAVRNVRMKHIQKYFTVKGESCKINPALKDRIDFSCYDLLDERSSCPPVSIFGDFDLIFCSNLLFYYRPDFRQIILNKICHSLFLHGFFITGEAEMDMAMKHGCFRSVMHPAPIFQKVRHRQCQQKIKWSDI